LIVDLVSKGNTEIVEKDIHGNYHFNGNFKNANDLSIALNGLYERGIQPMTEEIHSSLLALYERVFNHKAFTGRSGTFFAYEGLGSIYWHMVSKLLLAVQECYLKSLSEDANGHVTRDLQMHFKAIKKGIGVHKTPANYGAYPTDPYSHTPMHRGAQQPGMTGQVKEDIITRKHELGVHIKNGEIHFVPTQISTDDFLKKPQAISFINLEGNLSTLNLENGSLFFLYCQTPVVYQLGESPSLQVFMKDSTVQEFTSPVLNKALSQKVFARSGEVEKIHFQFPLP
jgi:hypothetical protein